MRIAIDPSPNSFTERFISYCQAHKIEYQLVSSASSDFIEKIRAFDIFMWHPYQGDYAQMQYGKHLTITLEKMGIKVFPDVATFYHFDDKIAETFLLQACNIPVVPGHIFYKKVDAVEWAKKASYPTVFKLRGGAGSVNVKLVHSKKQALKLIDTMFSTGMDGYGRFSRFVDVFVKFFQHKATLRSVLSSLKAYIVHNFSHSFIPLEYGYAYFQDFIANNKCDYRVIVIGDKAFSIKRVCRPNDFRASGSGNIVYSRAEQNEQCVSIAFEASKKLNTQCLAYDFVIDDGQPMIVEISFGFAMKAYDECDGFWTSDMVWHPGKFNPQYWIMENIIKQHPVQTR